MMRTEGRIHFANVNRVGDQLWPLIHEARPRVIALEMSAVLDLEYTALQALTDAERKLRSAGVALWLVALNPRVRDAIDRAPLGTALGDDRIFPSSAHAVEAYLRHVAEPTAPRLLPLRGPGVVVRHAN
jgi:MFS superfamily sulfate permease-like transporter